MLPVPIGNHLTQRLFLCVGSIALFVFAFSVPFADAQDSLPSWTNKSGRTIVAEFISLDGDSLEIQKDGKRFKIDLNTLSEASQRQAKDFARKAAMPLPQPSHFPSQLSLCLEFLGTASLGADNSLTVREPFFDPKQGTVKRWVKRNRKAMGQMFPYLEEQTLQIRNGALLGHYVSVVPVKKCYCFFLDGTPVKDHSKYFSQRPKTVLVAKQIGRNETQETAKTQAEKYLEMLDPFYRTVLRKDLVILVLPNKMGDKWLYPEFEPVASPEPESQVGDPKATPTQVAQKILERNEQRMNGEASPTQATGSMRAMRTEELEDRFIAIVKRNKDLNNNFKTASDTFEAVEFLAENPEKLSYYFDKVLEIERPDQRFERVRESLKRVGEHSDERQILLIGGAAAVLSRQVAFNRELRKKQPIESSVEEEYRSILIEINERFDANSKIAKNQVAAADRYVYDRSPDLDAAWERVLAGYKLEISASKKRKRWPPSITKVALIRVRLENENLEREVLLSGEGLCFPTLGGGYRIREKVKSGGYVMVTMLPGNLPPNGKSPVLKFAGLKHYSAATKIEFPEGDVVCGGEILLKSVPKESMGQLIVRCIPESGGSIDSGTIYVLPDGFGSEEFQLGDDGSVNADIAPGKYTVHSGRDLEWQGPPLEDVVVRPNETTEIGLKLFRTRVIEFEWCCRNPKESLEWKRGTSRVKSGGYWLENRFGNKYYQFFLSDWDGDSCTIQAVNHTSFVRSTKKELPINDGVPLPDQPANFSDRVLLPVVEGAVFDCRYDGRAGGDLGDFEIMFKVKSIEPVED